MPIKGLTDRGLAFPEIGQIRKGAKKEPNKPGADLTYFRVEFDEQEKKSKAAFEAIYKDKPAHIRIVLPFNEIEKMWDAWYEAYTAGRMVARSDGEFIQYQLDNNGDILVKNGLDLNGQKVPHPENGIAGKDYKGNAVKFKPTGRLKVILPELARAAYLTVMTTSIHDIANISDQLGAFKELNNGQIAGIPLILRRKPKAISMPKSDSDTSRVRRVKWLISIEADPEWVKAKLSGLRSLATPQVESLLLSESEDLTDAEVDYDEDDFSTDEVIQDVPVEEAESIELINPMDQAWVDFAAKAWNISSKDAAVELGKKKLGNKLDKRDFIQIVQG